jgi:hypothetical protein
MYLRSRLMLAVLPFRGCRRRVAGFSALLLRDVAEHLPPAHAVRTRIALSGMRLRVSLKRGRRARSEMLHKDGRNFT